jgi:hypothetical protein
MTAGESKDRNAIMAGSGAPIASLVQHMRASKSRLGSNWYAFSVAMEVARLSYL